MLVRLEAVQSEERLGNFSAVSGYHFGSFEVAVRSSLCIQCHRILCLALEQYRTCLDGLKANQRFLDDSEVKGMQFLFRCYRLFGTCHYPREIASC